MKAFVIDIARCNGCRACQVACKDEHCDNDWTPYAKPQPQTGQFWIKVEETVRGKVPVVKINYTPSICLHCADAPCAAACDQDAFERREDGLLVLNPEKCNGCMKCIEACPVNALFANDELKIAQKCTGCAHLLDDGWDIPRCVDVCPTDALRFGEEEDLKEFIAQAEPCELSQKLGTKVYYLNIPKRFVAGEVVDLTKQEVIFGAQVDLLAEDGSVVASKQTDDFGDFIFKQVEAAAYSVRIVAEGYGEKVMPADATDADVVLGEIDLA